MSSNRDMALAQTPEEGDLGGAGGLWTAQQDNEELMKKVASLQQYNSTLEEKVGYFN